MITNSMPGVLDLVFWIFIYSVIGMNFYLLDTKIGVSIHNWFKRMGSKDAEKYVKVNEGFIYNRKLKSKIFHATVISAILSVTVVWQGGSSIPVEIVMFTIEIPIVMLGFFIGPFYIKLLRISETAVEHYDKFEDKIEDTDLIEEAKNGVSKATTNIKNSINETTGSVIDSINETTDDVVDSISEKYDDVKDSFKSQKKPKEDKYQSSIDAIDDILGKK